MKLTTISMNLPQRAVNQSVENKVPNIFNQEVIIQYV